MPDAKHWPRRAQQGAADRLDWDAVLSAHNAVRPEHCHRLLTTARAWGEFWHLADDARLWRNDVRRARPVEDYSYVDWPYGPTDIRRRLRRSCSCRTPSAKRPPRRPENPSVGGAGCRREPAQRHTDIGVCRWAGLAVSPR